LKRQTNRIEVQAYDYFRRIEELGGVLPAIEKGFSRAKLPTLLTATNAKSKKAVAKLSRQCLCRP